MSPYILCIGASVQIADVAAHVNEQIRRQENSMKMLDIQNNLHGAPPIMAPGRWFIREERLMKVSGGDQLYAGDPDLQASSHTQKQRLNI